MAQPDPATAQVSITLDVTGARRKLRKAMDTARDALQALAQLDESLAQLGGREEALAHYGIRLVKEELPS